MNMGGVVETLRRSNSPFFAIVVVFLVRKGPLGYQGEGFLEHSEGQGGTNSVFGKACFRPLPTSLRGHFDENGENREVAVCPLKTITLPQKESGKRSLAKK